MKGGKPKKEGQKKGRGHPFQQTLDAPSLPTITLLVSPDEVRTSRAVALLLEKVFLGQNGPVNYLNGREFDLRDVTRLGESASSLSLFSTQEVSVLRHTEALRSAESKRLTELLPKFTEFHRLIMTASNMLAANPLRKFCESAGTYFEFERPKGHELTRWVERELARDGLRAESDEVLHALITIGEESLDAIVRTIEHLATYCTPPTLSLADVKALFPYRVTPSDFELLDRIGHTSPASSERLSGQLLGEGKSPFMLVGMFGRAYQSYLRIRYLEARGLSGSDLRNALNVSPWILQKQSAMARRYEVAELKRCLEAIARADSRLKNRSLGDVLIMSQLLHDLRPAPR